MYLRDWSQDRSVGEVGQIQQAEPAREAFANLYTATYETSKQN